MKRCENCGRVGLSEFDFCTECGGRMVEIAEPDDNTAFGEDAAQVGEQPINIETSEQKPQKQVNKKTVIIALSILAAIVIVIIAFAYIKTPRELVINDGKTIDMEVGDKVELKSYGEGLTESDYEDIVWTTNNNSAIKIEDGGIEAMYDADSFESVADSVCEGSAVLHGTLEKGLRTWEGSVEIKITLKPVNVESGKLIKKPSDAKNSYIVITGSKDTNAYFYFKSKNKPSNDLSFVIKKGDKKTVYVPCDTYEIYEAFGDAWYGREILFGPETTYLKDSGDIKFTSGTYWTFAFDAKDGNVESDFIDSDDFPQ